MPRISNDTNSISSVPLTDQGSTPTTPSSGKTRVFTKSDGLYIVNSSGTVTGPLAVASVVFTQGARVYNSATQAISSGVDTAITFNSERYDTDTIHDNSTNNTRLTCKTAGKYVIVGQIDLEAGGSSTYQTATIYLNGTTKIGYTHNYSSSSEGAGLNVVTVYDLAINDYVELFVKHTTGANKNSQVNANRSPEFMMQRIG